MQAIVLAAAGGPEFGPLCEGSPKGMLPFLGRPLLDHVVRYLERHGLSEMLVNLCEHPYDIERHFEANPPEQACLGFHLERSPLGTAGAVKRLAANFRETFVVCMGDLITDIDMEEAYAFHRASGALVTTVFVPGDRVAIAGRGTLDPDGRLRAFEEGAPGPDRPACAGIYLVEPDALGHIPAGPCDFGADLLPALLERNLPVFGYYSEAYWRDAGHPEGYMAALTDALEGRVPHLAIAGSEVSPGVWVHPEARLHAKAKLIAPAYVGAGAVLAQEAKVGPLATVEAGARLRRGAAIESGAALSHADLGAATKWKQALLYPDGGIDMSGPVPVVRPSDDPLVLGSTYRPALAEVLHTRFDQLIAAVALFVLAPVLLAIALAVKLDSPGPAFYTQLRVGQDLRPYRRGRVRGRVFEVFKFRTMHVDADAKVAELMAQNQYGGGAFFKLEHDPRITRMGHFFRKTSLDELPQLINVLKGEMRLVGNRPLPVYEAEALVEGWQRVRFLAPAGITGLWQISGRSDLSEKERLALDAYYAVSRHFLGDLGILFKTVPALLARRGAR